MLSTRLKAIVKKNLKKCQLHIVQKFTCILKHGKNYFDGYLGK